MSSASFDQGKPLYRKLLDVLREDLAHLRPGDRIESEPALALRFGVSRFTVARAIEILVDEGLIRRRQGLGSFVAPPPLKRAPGYLSSFTEAAAAQGRTAAHKVLGFGEISWREGLPFDPEQKLVRYDRLRLVDNIPTAIHRSILSADIARRIGLDSKSAAQPHLSLYRLFADAGLAAARGVETLRARLADAEERRWLELGDGPVIMEVTRMTYDASGALLDYVHAAYDARRYAYQAEIRSAAPAGGQTGMTKEVADAWNTTFGNDFGPRLGPWGDEGGSGGKAGGADHRARRPRRPVL